MKSGFNVIGISETWLTDNNINEYNMDGYSMVYNNRQRGRGGGVLLYINNSLNFKERLDLDINNEFIVSKFVELKSPVYKNVIIGCIYRTPSSNSIIPYFDYFSNLSDKLLSENKKMQAPIISHGS